MGHGILAKTVSFIIFHCERHLIKINKQTNKLFCNFYQQLLVISEKKLEVANYFYFYPEEDASEPIQVLITWENKTGKLFSKPNIAE